MVARSSIARASYHYILRLFLFYLFFSLATLSQTSENRHPRNGRGFSIQQNLCYSDFFQVPLKRTGTEKPKICTIFHAKSVQGQ